ncbi:MAG TPA: DUF72 domain-containing protein [Planctomycetota bacterium]|nr:DUF72 domain-containing protein [Planctomycetota bacterium]
MGEVRIGTSGYSFKDWVGPFYPPGTGAQGMLPFYAREFDAVEVNYTYYKPPTARVMAGMVEKTPAGFRFFVKAHRTFTHEGDCSAAGDFLAALAPMREAGRLSGVLFQFPQSFKNTEANRSYLHRIAELFGAGAAVEFRDRSWDHPAVYDFLEALRLNYVAVDEPEASTLFPRVARATGDIGYLRFHSRNAANWYKEGALRYDYLYSEAELREWVAGLKTMAGRARDLFVFFNNCHAAQAVQNARQMREILRQVNLWTG